jgi:hypothetical protein
VTASGPPLLCVRISESTLRAGDAAPVADGAGMSAGALGTCAEEAIGEAEAAATAGGDGVCGCDEETEDVDRARCTH